MNCLPTAEAVGFLMPRPMALDLHAFALWIGSRVDYLGALAPGLEVGLVTRMQLLSGSEVGVGCLVS